MSTGNRITLAGVIVTALGALVALFAWLTADASTRQDQTGDGDGDRIGLACRENATCVNQPALPPPDADDMTDEELAAQLRKPGVSPRKGPVPFIVLHDEDPQNLVIRSSPFRNGFRIGVAEHRSTVYVDCVRTSGFDPVPAVGWGPQWYKVHWPSSARSEAPMKSHREDPAQGWAYGFYLEPQGSNGEIPTCS